LIVADTNLLAYLLLPSERTRIAEAVFEKDAEWIAPLLWRSEMRNVLVLYMRQQGLTLAQAKETMREAERILRHREYGVPSERVLEVANETGLSAYDAEFLTIAQDLNVLLVSEDRQILAAAPAVAKSPEQFIKAL
jgi:predicted nucleic acid-binding protein